jgi:hypothetical protein
MTPCAQRLLINPLAYRERHDCSNQQLFLRSAPSALSEVQCTRQIFVIGRYFCDQNVAALLIGRGAAPAGNSDNFVQCVLIVSAVNLICTAPHQRFFALALQQMHTLSTRSISNDEIYLFATFVERNSVYYEFFLFWIIKNPNLHI